MQAANMSCRFKHSVDADTWNKKQSVSKVEDLHKSLIMESNDCAWWRIDEFSTILVQTPRTKFLRSVKISS